MGSLRTDFELARAKATEFAPNWERLHDWLFMNKSYLLRNREFLFELADELDSLGFTFPEIRLALVTVFEPKFVERVLDTR